MLFGNRGFQFLTYNSKKKKRDVFLSYNPYLHRPIPNNENYSYKSNYEYLEIVVLMLLTNKRYKKREEVFLSNDQ